MKKLSILLISILVAFAACTKSKEVHPEIGDGNDEIMTVGMKDVHVEYMRTDHAELQKVVFHYSLAETQQFAAAEMTKRETFFDLTLNDLLSDTLYYYYYELFPKGGSAFLSEQKTFHTQAYDQPPTPPVAELPTVITAEVSEITANSAVCGGEVTNDGGAEVIERGVCWGTSENPTLSDGHVVAGHGVGTFVATVTGLNASTTYHVRAYAINEVGTAYGLDREFNTLSGGGGGNGDAPEGAINGLFTINENGDQVYFSQGNLQYQASTQKWQFASNQYDYIGDDNSNISSSYSGWIDLFGWGTSGWNNGNTYYHPWDSNNSNASLYGPPGQYNLTGSYANADWGVYNPISNGGNTANQWRTLTQPEWNYVFNTRTTISGIRYAKANVNNVNGVILLPDDWSTSTYSPSNADSNGASFSSNTITAAQWMALEDAGAVFLPAAGCRNGTSLYDVGSNGYYWSASYNDNDFACYVYFNDSNLGTSDGNRYNGLSVRLVRVAE